MNAYLKKFLVQSVGEHACPAIQQGWEKVSLPSLRHSSKPLCLYVYDYFQSTTCEIKEIILALFAFVAYHLTLYVVTIDFVFIDKFAYRVAVYVVTLSVLLYGARYVYLRRSRREKETDEIFKTFLSQKTELCAAFPGIVQKCNAGFTLQEVIFNRFVELAGEVLRAEKRQKENTDESQRGILSNNFVLARTSVDNALLIAKYFVDFGDRKIIGEAFRRAGSK